MTQPIIVAALAAGSIACVTLALAFAQSAVVRTRRRRLTRFVVARAGGRAATSAPRMPVFAWLAARLAGANVRLAPEELLLVMFLFSCGGAATALALVGRVEVVPAAIGALAGGVPILWLRTREARRARRFIDQLPDTVGTIANALHAGFSLRQAIDQLAREAAEPTASVFAGVARDLSLGLTEETAFDRIASRHPSDDTMLLVAAVAASSRVGGSLARMLDTIATTMRERARIEADVRVLTSQQRYSAYVLAALPIIVGAFLYLISPEYISGMFTTAITRALLIAAAILVVIGFVVMRRMAAVDV
jgi:tight adherence protein B